MAASQRAIKKEEISSTEFPEGGNTIYTKRTPSWSTDTIHERLNPGWKLPHEQYLWSWRYQRYLYGLGKIADHILDGIGKP